MIKQFALMTIISMMALSPLEAAELELEEALSLKAPYCIDMRILSERKRAPATTSTKALNKLFNCKKSYVLPLSVRADAAMIQRYVKKLESFRGRNVLMWCTHGIRSATVETELSKVGIKIDTIKGGTFYLADAISIN